MKNFLFTLFTRLDDKALLLVAPSALFGPWSRLAVVSVIVLLVFVSSPSSIAAQSISIQVAFSDDFNDGDITNNPTWTLGTPYFNGAVVNQELHMDGVVDNVGRYRSIIFKNDIEIQTSDYLEISFKGLHKSIGIPQAGRQLEVFICDSAAALLHCYILSLGDQFGRTNLRFKLRYEEPGPDIIVNNSQPAKDVWHEYRAVRQGGVWSLYDNNVLLGSNPDPFSPLMEFGFIGVASVGSVIVDDVEVKVGVPVSRVFLVVDEDSIDNGTPPNFFSDTDVNAHVADIGLRTQLPFFAQHTGGTITLHTGEVGDEGWFALKTIPSSWTAAGPEDGLRNYINASSGLGGGNDPEALLDKIPDVTPLRATGLKQLEGQQICAVIYDGDVSINYEPLDGSLKGDNLGTAAFEVTSVTQLSGYSSSSLPKVEIKILDAEEVCAGELELFTDAPEPFTSSEPFDVVP